VSRKIYRFVRLEHRLRSWIRSLVFTCFCGKRVLGKKRADCYQNRVKQMLPIFQTLGARTSIKLHYLFSHLGRFPDNLGEVSEKQGERFHQAIKTMETRYQGRWDRHMMSDYCWSRMRDFNQQNYKWKSYKRAFQQVDWPNLDYREQLMFCSYCYKMSVPFFNVQ